MAGQPAILTYFRAFFKDRRENFDGGKGQMVGSALKGGGAQRLRMKELRLRRCSERSDLAECEYFGV